MRWKSRYPSPTERSRIAITYVRTESGLEGVGYEGAELIAEAVESLLEPMLVDEDPRDAERLWREMYDGTVQIGRSGLLLRAISTVDIALWVEYFYRDMDVKVFDDIVEEPLRPDDGGVISLPNEPGHGVRLDETAIERFRTDN